MQIYLKIYQLTKHISIHSDFIHKRFLSIFLIQLLYFSFMSHSNKCSAIVGFICTSAICNPCLKKTEEYVFVLFESINF